MKVFFVTYDVENTKLENYSVIVDILDAIDAIEAMDLCDNDIEELLKGIDSRLCKDYNPTSEAIEINMKRIAERMPK